MSNFVYDNTSLPTGKVDGPPTATPANQKISAAEWATVMQAMFDIRGALLAGNGAHPVSGSGNIQATDTLVLISGYSAQVTLTLPLASSVPIGKTIVIKDAGFNANTFPITLQRAGADLIENQPSQTFTTNGFALSIVSDGVSQWLLT